MKTPNITPAQIGALLTFVVGQAVAFGWLPGSREQTIVSVGSIVVAVALKFADAIIRHGRAGALAAAKTAALQLEHDLTVKPPAA